MLCSLLLSNSSVQQHINIKAVPLYFSVSPPAALTLCQEEFSLTETDVTVITHDNRVMQVRLGEQVTSYSCHMNIHKTRKLHVN